MYAFGAVGQDDGREALIEVFFKGFPEKRKELERGINQADLGALKRGGHSLKSSLGYIGAVKACELARGLQTAGDLVSACRLARELVAEIERFKSERE